jgi:hypothetical protein
MPIGCMGDLCTAALADCVECSGRGEGMAGLVRGGGVWRLTLARSFTAVEMTGVLTRWLLLLLLLLLLLVGL